MNIASILLAFTSYHERVKPREHDIRSLDVMTVAGLPSSVFYAVACIHHQGEFGSSVVRMTTPRRLA